MLQPMIRYAAVCQRYHQYDIHVVNQILSDDTTQISTETFTAYACKFNWVFILFFFMANNSVVPQSFTVVYKTSLFFKNILI